MDVKFSQHKKTLLSIQLETSIKQFNKCMGLIQNMPQRIEIYSVKE